MTDPPAPGDDFGDVLLGQALELWINPEIERRMAEGRVPEDFALVAAQIVFEVGQAPAVRLNEEVRAVARFIAARAIAKGEDVMVDDLAGLEGVELTDEDPNAGHLTVLRVRDGWAVAFDLRYNAERVAAHRDTAREFLDTARFALEGDRRAAFSENLYAAVELMAKGSLLTSPDEVMLKVRQHRYVAAQYNLDRKLGNVDPRFAALLNDLAARRKRARYAEGELRVDPGDARDQLAVAEEMYEDLGARAPTRALSHDDEAGGHEPSDP